MESVKQYLKEATEAVNLTLSDLLGGADIRPSKLSDAIAWSIFGGGKRFRPALVLAAGEAFGAEKPSLLNTAAAFEMIHTYSLIHDDLPSMDNDDLRRGRETCHVKFGSATAILAGDMLQSFAFATIAGDGELNDPIKLAVMNELAAASNKMVQGQQMDLDAEDCEVEISDLETIHEYKTGALIRASVRAGAVIAGAPKSQLESVSDFAGHLGLLFQITDDILDATQSSDILGKTAGKDEKSRKATYVSLYGLEEAREMANKSYGKAVEALSNSGTFATRLGDLADYILSRDR
jgi:geranylgeranyl diphosphate synthase, type II